VKQSIIVIVALLICLLVSPIMNANGQTDSPVMRAVLFYSPTCGHCEYVINETLIPMLKKYGERLQIIAVDVSQPASQELFFAAMQKFELERAGVPFLVFDDTYLIGSGDIPEQFPGLVETYLAQGGLDWPDIPGLTDAMAPQNTPQPTPTTVPVVRAVYFYRSACSHCQKLTEEVIPPLIEKYGAQLEIFGIDVSSPQGDALYDTAIDRFKIEKFGVPTLILGEQVLVGGTEIQERFAGIIAGYVSDGGRIGQTSPDCVRRSRKHLRQKPQLQPLRLNLGCFKPLRYLPRFPQRPLRPLLPASSW
jgi:thiol-disulfide isomerase/thioredoxin